MTVKSWQSWIYQLLEAEGKRKKQVVCVEWETVPPGMTYLNTWSTLVAVFGEVIDPLRASLAGGIVLLGEWVSSAPLLVHSLCFMPAVKDVNSQFLLRLCAVLPTIVDALSGSDRLFFLQRCHGPGILITQQKSNQCNSCICKGKGSLLGF